MKFAYKNRDQLGNFLPTRYFRQIIKSGVKLNMNKALFCKKDFI